MEGEKCASCAVEIGANGRQENVSLGNAPVNLRAEQVYRQKRACGQAGANRET